MNLFNTSDLRLGFTAGWSQTFFLTSRSATSTLHRHFERASGLLSDPLGQQQVWGSIQLLQSPNLLSPWSWILSLPASSHRHLCPMKDGHKHHDCRGKSKTRRLREVNVNNPLVPQMLLLKWCTKEKTSRSVAEDKTSAVSDWAYYSRHAKETQLWNMILWNAFSLSAGGGLVGSLVLWQRLRKTKQSFLRNRKCQHLEIIAADCSVIRPHNLYQICTDLLYRGVCVALGKKFETEEKDPRFHDWKNKLSLKDSTVSYWTLPLF